MSPNVTIRPFAAHEWPAYRDLRLRALADAPDAFGATLAAEAARPGGEWAERLGAAARARTALPLLAEVGGEPVGLAWGRVEPADPDAVGLYQMWVAPEARGRGVGEQLLNAVVEWAEGTGARRVALGVTCGDTAARRLYARAGFVPVGAPEPLRAGSALLCQRMERGVGAGAG